MSAHDCRACPTAYHEACIFNREAALREYSKHLITIEDIERVRNMAHKLMECKMILLWRKEAEERK